MTARHMRNCYPTLVNSLLLLILLPVSSAVVRAGLPTQPLKDMCTPLYVEIMLNQKLRPDIYPLCQNGAELYTTLQTLTDIGFRNLSGSIAAPEGLVSLSAINGVTARYDALMGRVYLMAPADLLQSRRYSLNENSDFPEQLSPSLPGAQFNYSIYGTNTNGINTASGWTEWRLANDASWSLSDSMQFGWENGGHKLTRLDTRLTRDFPQQSLALTLGDTTTGISEWTQQTRIMGVQITRDFGLHPLSTTVPDTTLVGQATLPSVVDIYVNNVRQTSQQVTPGTFDIGGMPLRNGINSVEMVITDLTGKKTVRSYNLYGSPSLLQPGLTDGSLEVGGVRHEWGVKNYSVESTPVFSGTLRHGVSDNLSLATHAENSSGLQMFGAGVEWVPVSELGVINAAVMWGREGMDDGRALQWSWRRSSDLVNLSLASKVVTDGYRDIAVREGGGDHGKSCHLFASFNTVVGSPAVGLVSQEDTLGQHQRYLSLSWSRTFGDGTVSLTLNRQSGSSPSRSLAVWLSFPLGHQMDMNMSHVSSGHESSFSSGLSWRADENNAYRVNHARNARKSEYTELELRHREYYGDVDVGLTQATGTNKMTSLNASLSGSAVLLEQGMFLTSRIGDAFGLVSTAGVAGIPVKLENNLVGVTDSRGFLFLDTLQPWQHNRVSLDIAAIPDRWLLEDASAELVPARHSGALASFNIHPNNSVELILYDKPGHILPPGSQVKAGSTGAVLTQVGYDGLVWLSDPLNSSPLIVEGGGQSDCRIVLSEGIINRAQQGPVPVICQ